MGDCDVAIIGAGIVGASIAYELASRGLSVTVLDSRRSAGQGATQAAAGMLAPYIEGLGKPILPMAARSLAMYDDFVGRIAADTGITVDYHRAGSLQVMTADDSAKDLGALHAEALAAGVRCTLLDAAGVRDLEPLLTPEIESGLLIVEHGVAVPDSLWPALMAAAQHRGAVFESDCEVKSVATTKGGFTLDAGRGRITASRVVLAAGSWSGKLMVGHMNAVPVRPVRGQL